MKVLSNRVTIDETVYCTLPLEDAIQYHNHLTSKFLIQLGSGKLVAIHYDNSKILEVLENYQKRNLKEILVEEEDYWQFLTRVREELATKINDEAISDQEKLVLFDQGFSVLKDGLERYGLNNVSLSLANEVITGSEKLTEVSPNLYKLFEKFRSRCRSGFTETLLRLFFGTIILKKLPWCKPTILDKLRVGILLSDVFLTQEGHSELVENHGNRDALSEAVLLHPRAAFEAFKKSEDLISTESLDVILHHHEMPDGSGFPNGIDHSKISHLCAVAIVADHIARFLIQTNFNAQKKDQLMDHLQKNFSTYGKFDKVHDVVCRLFQE